ncbi:MAG: hypothetical protein R3F24_04545 [Gammaproteobacteria bacterium]
MTAHDNERALADYLGSCLPGHRAERVLLGDQPCPSLTGITITSVTTADQCLNLNFADGQTLRSRLGDYGSWHRYPDGQENHDSDDQPGGQLSMAMIVDGEVFACFNAAEVELLGPATAGGQSAAARLTSLAHRVQALCPPGTLLIDILVDQHIAAGIGNVRKSELLFQAHLTPGTRLADLSLQELESLLSLSTRLPQRRRVYGREDLPCYVCGTPIRFARLGTMKRGTFWCPKCQEGLPQKRL